MGCVPLWGPRHSVVGYNRSPGREATHPFVTPASTGRDEHGLRSMLAQLTLAFLDQTTGFGVVLTQCVDIIGIFRIVCQVKDMFGFGLPTASPRGRRDHWTLFQRPPNKASNFALMVP